MSSTQSLSSPPWRIRPGSRAGARGRVRHAVGRFGVRQQHQNGQTTFGVSAGGMGAGIIGGEADFGWSPSFFGTKSDFGNNTVMNLMGNLIIGVPVGGTARRRHSSLRRRRRRAASGRRLTAARSHGVIVEQHVRLGCGRRRDGLLQRSRRPARRPALPARDERSETDVSSLDLSGNQLHFWRASIGVVIR